MAVCSYVCIIFGLAKPAFFRYNENYIIWKECLSSDHGICVYVIPEYVNLIWLTVLTLEVR